MASDLYDSEIDNLELYVRFELFLHESRQKFTSLVFYVNVLAVLASDLVIRWYID